MIREEAKILGYLSDHLGSGGSILSITEGIKKKYGFGYYPNIYNAIKKLRQKGALRIEKEGKSSLININFDNPNSTYYLSEIENQKSTELKIPKNIMAGALDLGLQLNPISICALEADKHLKINRIELLVLTDSPEIEKFIEQLSSIEIRTNIRIDPIILTISEFARIMKTEEQSTLKDMLLDRNILYNSEGFWRTIMRYGINGKYKKMGKSLHDLSENELAYNYGRFGYTLYEQLKEADKISLEETIFLMSIKTEARITYGAIILLYKNLDESSGVILLLL